jgi:hypothetical protein
LSCRSLIVRADGAVDSEKYGPDAIAELARLATQAESEAARVAAIKELLDRGYGRAGPSGTLNFAGSRPV